MDAVTDANIRSWSKLDWATLGYGTAGTLGTIVTWSTDYVLAITGRTLADMPADLVSIAQQAILRRVEQVAQQNQPDYQETAADDLVASFGAGKYNESRAKRDEVAKLINPNPELHNLLWHLMTDEKREEYLQLVDPDNNPAVYFEGIEVDWQNWGLPPSGMLWGGA